MAGSIRGIRNGRVPKYHSKPYSGFGAGKSYVDVAADNGGAGVLFKALGEFGNKLMNDAAKDKHAAQVKFINEMDRNASEMAIKIATNHSDDPDAFNQHWENAFKNSGENLPEEFKDGWNSELERKRLQQWSKIYQNKHEKDVAERNAGLIHDADRHFKDAMNGFRAGDKAMGPDGNDLKDPQGNPVSTGREALEKYLATMNARTDLSPQRKEELSLRAYHEAARQGQLGAFDDALKHGEDTAEKYLKSFEDGQPPEGMDVDSRDRIALEMRREFGRFRQEKAERQRENMGEANRIVRNNLARIENGEEIDPNTEDQIRSLAGDDVADEYIHKADRAKTRKDQLDDLIILPPKEAWKLHSERKPDATSERFAEEQEDWVHIGRALEQANRKLADDPAAYVAESVRQEIERKQLPGGTLNNGTQEDIAAAQREASIRRQKELGIHTPCLFDKQTRSNIVQQFEDSSTGEQAALIANLQQDLGTHWSQAFRELQEAGLPPEAGHASTLAQRNPALSRKLLEGYAVRKLEPDFSPANDTALRDALKESLPQQVMQGFTPRFSKGLTDTVMSAYAFLSKQADDRSKVVNKDRLKDAVNMVTDGVVEYDRPGLGSGTFKTFAPLPGMTSDEFTDLIDGIDAKDIGSVYVPSPGKASGGLVSFDNIRRYGDFVALGNGKYGVTVNSTPLVKADGTPFILDLRTLYDKKRNQSEGQ